jgi:HlyD family secretion protein
VPGAPANAQQSRGALSALMPSFPRRMFTREQRGGRMGKVWVLDSGKPALAMFKPGATDGRVTQVLPLGPLPTSGRMAAMANDEKFKAALSRKIEPGTKVIVDEEAPKK